MKRWLFCLLAAVCLCLAAGPAVRAAEIVNYAVTGGNIQFDKSTGTVTDCDWSVTEASIPSKIAGVSVTSIGSLAFSNCTHLTSVTIPSSVTSIEELAFSYCSSLTSVTIPSSVTFIGFGVFRKCSNLTNIAVAAGSSSYSSSEGVLFNKDVSYLHTYPAGKSGAYSIPSSVTSIGQEAFIYCSGLTNVTIPNSVTSIEEFAFSSCDSLTSVTIPNSVTSIGQHAFQACKGLTSMTIPNSVTSIAYPVFYLCSNLTGIEVAADNPSYSSIDGVLFNKTATNLHTYPAGKSGAYSIPNSVTSIGNCAFSGCIDLTSVTIPNNVTSISHSAFRNCDGLTSVTIPNSVTFIGNAAFDDCDGLTSVTIPNGVTFIGNYTFSCRRLTNITIPSSVTSIGYGAFFHCDSLTDVYYDGTEAEYDAKLRPNVNSEQNSYFLNAKLHYNSGTSPNPPTGTLPNTAAEDSTTVHGTAFLLLAGLTLTVWAVGRRKKDSD